MPDTATQNRRNTVPFKAALTVVVVVGALVYILRKQTAALGPMTPMREVGLALVAIGLAGWVTARIQLGRSFSIRAKATELVTHGIYSKIRNPVYVFGTLLLVGLILWF